MRKKREKQLPLMSPSPAHPKARELEIIIKILDQNLIDMVKLLLDDGADVSVKNNVGQPLQGGMIKALINTENSACTRFLAPARSR